MVNDTRNTTHNLSVFVGQKIFSLAELKGGISVFTQGMHLVSIQVWCIVGIATIQVIVELDKAFELFLGGNFPNFY